MVYEYQFLVALALEHILEPSFTIESFISKNASEGNQRYFFSCLGPFHKLRESVLRLMSGRGIMTFVALAYVFIIVSSFHPALHMPTIVVGHITFSSTGCECLHIQLMTIKIILAESTCLFFMKRLSHQQFSDLIWLCTRMTMRIARTHLFPLLWLTKRRSLLKKGSK